MSRQKHSNAEAMRKQRARIKMNYHTHQQYLEKERERYQRRKEEGKLKTVHDLTSREQTELRKKWRKEKRAQRAVLKKNKQNGQAEPFNLSHTPPPSPVLILQPSVEDDLEPAPSTSRSVEAARLRAQRNRKRDKREIAKQSEIIREKENSIRRLKRRVKRLQSTFILHTHRSDASRKSDSPATKAAKISQSRDPNRIRRELTFGFTLRAELHKKLKTNCRTHREKNALHKIITGPILAKYRLLHKAKNDINMSRTRMKNATRGSIWDNDAKKRVCEQSVSLVKQFYESDVNSTPAAGKKETITRKKQKKQRRYLTDTMLNLYENFKAQEPSVAMSYTTFTRLRPFYVVPPSVERRDTVQCKMHSNIELKATKLHLVGVIKSPHSSQLIRFLVCSDTSRDCMYGTCELCKDKINAMYTTENAKNSDDVVKFYQWENTSEERNTPKGTITVKVVKKMEKSCPLRELCDVFEEDMKKLMPHQYRITHQYQAIKDLKGKLRKDECVLQVDFSENYACKAAQEVQSMHFGASRQQVCLHTSHASFRDGTTQCYCTLSSDTRHNPPAIWAHLFPVLEDLKANGILTIHFVSDGPTTQYKNKSSFRMLCTKPISMGFQKVTWNFLEASHGKGPADGIGAAVKSTADRLVAHGKDILNIKMLFDVLPAALKGVQLFEISTQEIDKISEALDKFKTPTIKGTMQIHQVLVSSKDTFFHRKLSCYCENRSLDAIYCACYSPARVNLKTVTEPATIQSVRDLLSDGQLKKFAKRLAEGYDVEIPDLTVLGDDERKEYLLWKTWAALKMKAKGVGPHHMK